MPLILALEAIAKSYGSLRVLDGLSLELAEGEALGIIGPNGAGKSTLLDIVAGAQRADRGRVRFAGEDVSALPAHVRCRRGIGRSYQIPQPFANMTVFENVLVSAAYGTGRRQAQCHAPCIEVLRTAGLLPRANALAGALPLLDRKRLELARALATEPRLLLLDEIAGGLTEDECQRLVQTIRGIHAAGTAIVWIEHIVHALVSVVGRLIVIADGGVLADGVPDAVMHDRRVQETYLGIDAA